ncbi:hypothetical protein [Serratia fonticola]|uniref:hypothetical protein n=1 Tax=Serratia fonticola TaxID=47917 RepID=UPI0009395A44|nr:hypothetical protein [Serratia fonticola]OKP29581.1 hypothetical protein BSQ40_07030 [Serratia fonticola]
MYIGAKTSRTNVTNVNKPELLLVIFKITDIELAANSKTITLLNGIFRTLNRPVNATRNAYAMISDKHRNLYKLMTGKAGVSISNNAFGVNNVHIGIRRTDIRKKKNIDRQPTNENI